MLNLKVEYCLEKVLVESPILKLDLLVIFTLLFLLRLEELYKIIPKINNEVE
jgi:hypothetical protein